MILKIHELITNLTIHDISSNKFCVFIKPALRRDKIKKKLTQQENDAKGDKHFLRELNIENNNIGNKRLIEIFESIYENETLKKISIGGNTTYKKSQEKLSSSLKKLFIENRTIKYLSLKGVIKKMLLSNVASSFSGLRTNSTIRYLDISLNCFGKGGLLKIFKYLNSNKSIFSFQWQAILEDVQSDEHFFNLIQKNPNICISSLLSENLFAFDTIISNFVPDIEMHFKIELQLNFNKLTNQYFLKKLKNKKINKTEKMKIKKNENSKSNSQIKKKEDEKLSKVKYNKKSNIETFSFPTNILIPRGSNED
ncbi:leucine rich repeat family protein [Anaeramoeba flamelloides]|uniref:Leucine rich repeat family protein n=1 Tax=Anaeramoeba flamelloides TaxID=1746091 RepID=A0AAV7YXW6_9EUKA|nr:leucine rich repeat family protein [Anaeramoeba flamelloides]